MIEDNYSPMAHVGNGVATEFTVGWPFAADSEVKAKIVEAGQADVALVLDTDYSVAGAGEEAGGTLSYPLDGTPLAATQTLVVWRETAVSQERNWEGLNIINPPAIGAGDDKITRILQEQQERLGRCVQVGVMEDVPEDYVGDCRDAQAVAVAAQAVSVAASMAAQEAAAKVPDIEAGDADAFLTVKADESGNEYVGGAGARAKLGLGEAALEDVVPVAKGGTGATDAATARGNLGCGPAAVEDALTAHRYVYVAQDGSDDTGDGSSGSPYQTVNKALDSLGGLLITPQSYATIRVRGYLEDHPEIAVQRKNQGIVAIMGERTPTGYDATSYTVSGTGTDLEVAFAIPVACALECAVGQYAIVEDVNTSYGSEDIKLTGCWKITAVDAVSGIVTLLVKDHSGGTAPGTGAPCTIVPMRDGIGFAPGVHGIQADYDGIDLGLVGNLVLAGGDGDDPTASVRYGVDLQVGSRAWFSGRVGITGWHTGIMSTNGTVEASVMRISNCQYGAYNEGGIFRAGNIQITGCVYRGFRGQYSTQNMIHGDGKVIAGCGTGVYAYYGAFIAAQSGVVDHNGDNFQPNALTIGNAQSYIYA